MKQEIKYDKVRFYQNFIYGDGKNAVKHDKRKMNNNQKDAEVDDYDELGQEFEAEIIQDKFNNECEKELIMRKLDKW